MPLASDLTGGGIVPYFEFSHSGITFTDQDLNERITSFTITEKEREFLTGSIVVKDDIGLANKILSYGQKIQVEWGLKKLPIFPTNYVDEIRGNFTRGPITCQIISSNAQLTDGLVYLNVGFRIGTADGARQRQRIFNSGSVRQAITTIANELQASIYIDFNQADYPLSDKFKLIQAQESNLQFLRNLAAKFNCKFTVQEDPKTIGKIMKLYFVDYSRQILVNTAEQRGFTGLYHYLDYGTKEANIISGDLSSNANAIGGSSISYEKSPTGQLQAVVRAADTETVEVWELSPEKIKQELRGKPISEAARLTQEIISSNSLEDFTKAKGYRERYFVKKTTTTAPEGAGLTCNLDVIPNPNYLVGDLVFLGSEACPLPPQFKSRKGNIKTLWRITSNEQSISDGYKMKLELAR